MDDARFQVSLIFWPSGRDEEPQILGNSFDPELTAHAREVLTRDHQRELLVMTGSDDSSDEAHASELEAN